ncbi:DUF2269 domain-containing protein [Blastococcus saxobsidens]|uniref:DUF2269 domain-containing protein n=1 Tax=Blastococcus saxobsidens TaxID=138336 RepID=A0A4Q7YBT7_9ACTN|nr:DUF2269 domain-containing protein [Blastococcus saxobsidens]RZU33913.1 hypothetical protein BKA19_3654 [Blastococcus saxobsidens]
MTAPPVVRKATLTLHVTSSVGWLGAVVVAVALSAVVAGSSDAQLVRAGYLVLDRIGWWVLVPLAVASLVSGVLQSLLTPWGLVRHWWVVVKLVLTVLATGVLLLYTGTLGRLAATARIADGSAVPLSSSPLVHSLGALVVLLGAVVLSVHKPRGLTRYGWRMQQAGRAPRA